MNTSEPGGKLMAAFAVVAVIGSIGWMVYFAKSQERPPVPRGAVTSTVPSPVGTMALSEAAAQGHGPMAMAARAANRMPADH